MAMLDTDRKALLKVLASATVLVVEGKIEGPTDVGLIANALLAELEVYSFDVTETRRQFMQGLDANVPFDDRRHFIACYLIDPSSDW